MARASFLSLFTAGLILLPLSPASAQSNGFECSEVQAAIIEQQKYSSNWLVAEVIKGLDRGDFRREMHQWFGTHSVAFRAELRTRLSFAQYYIRAISPKCLKRGPQNDLRFAFVEPKNPKPLVYFGKLFFEAPELFVCQKRSPSSLGCEAFKLSNDGELRLSKDTMIGTIIHEVLHFDRIWSDESLYTRLQNPMVGIDDVDYINPETGKKELLGTDKFGRPVYRKVYGQSKALETASLYPERAQNNADNFQFFVEAALESLLKPVPANRLKAGPAQQPIM